MTVLSSEKGPLYLQIKQIIEDRIIHGIYTVGNNIPTETDFEKEFNVSKVTVRAAIKELVALGYLEKKSGKGTRVISHKPFNKVTKNKNFTEKLVEEGNEIKKVIKDIAVVSNLKNSELYKLFGENAYKITRVYLLNNRPYILFNHYLPYPLHSLNEYEKQKQNNDLSIYKILEEANIEIINTEDSFSVKKDITASEYLELDPSVSLLVRERQSFNNNSETVEYSIGYYNSDLKKYSISLNN
ncbi:GntR family transcriptional regulator [Mammaliicoccus sciuri]